MKKRFPRTVLGPIAFVALLAMLAAACSVSGAEVMAPTTGDTAGRSAAVDPSGAVDPSAAPDNQSGRPDAVDIDPPTDPEAVMLAADAECGDGLTDQGEAMLASGQSADDVLPDYELSVVIRPTTGEVTGSMLATVPATEDTQYFRVFAGMDAFRSNLDIFDVFYNGDEASFDIDTALLTVDTPGAAGELITVGARFEFTIAQMAANEGDLFGALSGDTLAPDQVGLLGRTETGMQLGHWFPVWIPQGSTLDPDPSGFGDIGAFAASRFCTRISVPEQYTVVSGGVDFGRLDTGVADLTTHLHGGTGLRDFAIMASNDLGTATAQVDGVDINVWGPADDPEAIQTVLDFSIISQEALIEAFGPYPWEEIDVVATPLGSGVGGMEWPGMIWIERNMFAGGLPGMGDLGALLGGDNDLLAELGGPAISTVLEWTVAHELAHEWWHALVGNDSIASPAVDEPLAQVSACIAMQRIHPDNWFEICEAQTLDQFAQTRALGIPDTAADQASDQFESALQYGAVVYGKAPGFYYEAAELLGWDWVTDSLAAFVDEYSFTLVGTDVLRQHLVDSAGDAGPTIDDLWQRWFSEARGDDDIEPSDLFGGLGGLGGGGLGDLDGLDLDELFGEDSPFGGGDLNFDELFGEDSPFGEGGLGDLDLDELFGDDSPFNDPAFQELLEDLLGGGN